MRDSEVFSLICIGAGVVFVLLSFVINDGGLIGYATGLVLLGIVILTLEFSKQRRDDIEGKEEGDGEVIK